MSALVERDEALKTLEALWHSCRASAGQVAVVSGEAGLGKTSLVEKFLAGLEEGAVTAWGRCDDLFKPRQLGAFNDMAGLLGSEAEAAIMAGGTPAFLYPTVLAALDKLPEGAVVVFEDIHWADHASLDLLKFIVRRITPLRLLMVLTYRPDEIAPEHPLMSLLGDLPPGKTRRIELAPLSREAVAALAIPGEHTGTELHRVTGGNPFFLSEILAHQDGAGSLPVSVRDAVLARASRLGSSERAVLESLCIVPDPVSEGVAAALLGADGVETCSALESRGFLVREAGGQWRFRHELARLAMLDSLSASEQRSRHQQLLRVYLNLEKPVRPDLIVHHAAAVDDAELLLAYAPLAAEEAARVGACKEAAALLAVAIEHVESAGPELAATLYENWAYQSSLFEITDDVIAARLEAIARWRDLERLERVGDNLRALWRLYWYRGETAKAKAAATESLQILEAIPPSRELGVAYSLRSQLSLMSGQRERAIEWGYKAISVAEQFNDELTQVQAMVTVATAELFDGDDGGRELMEKALSIAHKHAFHEEIARIHTNYAEYAIHCCDWSLAKRLIREGLAFDIKHGLDAWTTYLKGRHAQLYLHRGRLEHSETLARSVLAEDGHTILMRLPAMTTQAIVRSRIGAEDAEDLLEKILAIAIDIGEQQRITPVRLALMQHHYIAGNLSAARHHAEEMLSFGTAILRPWDAGALKVWLQRLDLPLPADLARDPTQAQTLELTGDYKGAAAVYEKLDLPFEAALCFLAGARGGELLLANDAARIFAAIDCNPGCEAARELGVSGSTNRRDTERRRGPYRASRKHPLGLTRREVEILSMMAEGASNFDIAHKLSRSPRTVEHHVSSILGKLNASNRLEATLRVIAEPWIAEQGVSAPS